MKKCRDGLLMLSLYTLSSAIPTLIGTAIHTPSTLVKILFIQSRKFFCLSELYIRVWLDEFCKCLVFFISQQPRLRATLVFVLGLYNGESDTLKQVLIDAVVERLQKLVSAEVWTFTTYINNCSYYVFFCFLFIDKCSYYNNRNLDP